MDFTDLVGGLKGEGLMLKKRIIAIMITFCLVLTIVTDGSLIFASNPSENIEDAVRSQVTGSPDFTIDLPDNPTGLTVNAATFGFSETNTGLDNYLAMFDAIEYCKTNNAAKLIVDPGTYYVGYYDADQVRIVDGILLFDGFTDFTFDAQGSEFIFEAKSNFITIKNSTRFELKNIDVEWNWNNEPILSLGIIDGIDPNGDYIDIRFPDDPNPDPDRYVAEIVEVDPLNDYRFTNTSQGIIGGWQLDTSLTQSMGGNVLRFYQDPDTNGAGWFTGRVIVGQNYLVRHHKYTAHGIKHEDNTHLTMDNINIYSTIGMGFIGAGKSHHIQLINSKVVRNPNTPYKYRLSSATDGFHIQRSMGNIKVLNTEFRRPGDDALNIHDTISKDIEVIDSYNFTAKNTVEWRNPFEPGDPIELLTSEFAPSGYTSTVVSAVYDEINETCQIQVADALPSGTPSDSVVVNRYYNSANVIIKDSVFSDTRVRGLMLYNSNITFENNLIENNYKSGLHLHQVTTSSAEGYRPQNILIRNNTFKNNNIDKSWSKVVKSASGSNIPEYPADLVIWGLHKENGIVEYPIVQNLIVEDNVFEESNGELIQLGSADHVLITGNRVVNPSENEIQPVVRVLESSNVVFANNAYEGSVVPSVEVDWVSASDNVIIEDFDNSHLISMTTHKDTYVDEGTPTVNYGSGSDILVGNAGLEQSGYLSFNLETEVVEQVQSASLSLNVDALGDNSSRIIEIYEADSSWDEAGINYNNAPSLGNLLGSFTIEHSNYILTNAGFEDDLTTWGKSENNGAAVFITSAEYTEGSKALKIDNGQSGGDVSIWHTEILSKDGAPAIGVPVRLSGQVKLMSAQPVGDSFYMQVKSEDASGVKTTLMVGAPLPSDVKTGEWVTYETDTFVIPPDAVNIIYTIKNDVDGVVYVDDLTIYEAFAVENHSFESDLTDWSSTVKAGATVSVSSTEAMAGSKSVKVDNGLEGNANISTYSDFSATKAPDKEANVKLRIWVKVDQNKDFSRNANIIFKYKDAAGSAYELTRFIVPSDIERDTWVNLESEVVSLPAEATEYGVVIDDWAYGIMYYDNISIIKDGVDQWYDVDVTAYVNNVMTSSLYTLTNPGFENGLNTWGSAPSNGSVVSVSTSEARTGTGALQINNGIGGWASVWHSEILSNPDAPEIGVPMKLGAWVKIDAAVGAKQLYITVKSVDDAGVKTTLDVTDSLSTDTQIDDWVFMTSDSFVIPSDAKEIIYTVFSGLDGSAYVDDIKVFKASEVGFAIINGSAESQTEVYFDSKESGDKVPYLVVKQ